MTLMTVSQLKLYFIFIQDMRGCGRIALIKPYLSESITAQLISSFIMSRKCLDYCTTIFDVLPATENLNKLSAEDLKQCSHISSEEIKTEHVSPLLQITACNLDQYAFFHCSVKLGLKFYTAMSAS